MVFHRITTGQLTITHIAVRSPSLSTLTKRKTTTTKRAYSIGLWLGYICMGIAFECKYVYLCERRPFSCIRKHRDLFDYKQMQRIISSTKFCEQLFVCFRCFFFQPHWNNSGRKYRKMKFSAGDENQPKKCLNLKMCSAPEKRDSNCLFDNRNAVRLSNYKFYVITDRTSFPQLLLDV